MKRLHFLLLLVLASLLSGGCGSAYMKNRVNDAADIFSLGAGVGIGAQARISFLQLGLMSNKEFLGLREGNAMIYGPETQAHDSDWLLYRHGNFTPLLDPVQQERRKSSNGYTGWVLFSAPHTDRIHMHWLTQVELVGALGPSIRFGVNPLELVDFVLGFTTFDFFGDDIAIPVEKPAEEPEAAPAAK